MNFPIGLPMGCKKYLCIPIYMVKSTFIDSKKGPFKKQMV